MLKRTTLIPIEPIIIEDEGSHILVRCKINGHDGRMLIDTGASRTVFDQEKILSFVSETSFLKHDKLSTGLGTNSMPTSVVILNSFSIGDLLIKDFNAVLLDLSHVNNTYSQLGHLSIDGVLGNDILVKHKAIINYKKRSLSLAL